MSRHSDFRSDRGVTLVVFALSLTAILGVIVLVLGGSLGYTAERNSQTASDVAALAATSVLRNLQTGESGVLPEHVQQTAVSVAEDNGADEGVVTCVVIEADLDEIGPCNDANVQSPTASGVRVLTSDSRDVPFGGATGQAKIKGATGAAATIQPLAEGRSPFMLCTPSEAHASDILVPDGGGNWTVNDAAVGSVFALHGNPIKEGGRDCGNPDKSWRGLVEYESTFSVPGWWGVENGNKNGQIPRLLAGNSACGGQGVGVQDFVDCELIVPLCVNGNGSNSDFQLYCVGLGRFRIVHNGNGPSVDLGGDPDADCWDKNAPHICGEFLGGGIATGGQGTVGQAEPNEVVVIKLVE